MTERLPMNNLATCVHPLRSLRVRCSLSVRSEEKMWCRSGDLNPDGIAPARP